MAAYPDLTPEQWAALEARFGGVLDVRKEEREARQYAENFATRRYRSYPQFVRNWMLRSEKDRRPRAAGVASGGTVSDRLSPEQLRAIAEDANESEDMRRMARLALGEE